MITALLLSGQFTPNATQTPMTLRRKIDAPQTTQFEFKSTDKIDNRWTGPQAKALKPESNSTTTTQVFTETLSPTGPGEAKINFTQNSMNGQGGVAMDDYTVDERDRGSASAYQAKFSDQSGTTANTSNLSFLFKLPLTFSFPEKPVSPGDFWSDHSAASSLDFQFKVLSLRCVYKGQGTHANVPCYHLVLTEQLGNPWDMTSSSLSGSHTTGKGDLEADIYIRQDDGDIQAETVKQNTLMNRLDGQNHIKEFQTLDIRRLD
ncbi:MAG TPA: hypothetical protein VGL56_17290 [Fimbriimonadaceae bacterium]|jgi:hypothetical protein